jgi:aryl-alcohol dehydrogenase-like predicted oxidoreductase
MVTSEWTETEKRQMDILSDLKSKGIIRAHGVSVHTWEAMKTAVESPWVDVLHARINPYGIAMDKPEPEEVVSLIHKLHDSGKGVIGMKLVGGGEYVEESDKIDNALRFVLGLGSVDMIIVGFQEEAQIDNYTGRMKSALSEIKSV